MTEPICPLCHEQPPGIDGICAACWLTLARLESDHGKEVPDEGLGESPVPAEVTMNRVNERP